MAKFVLDTVIDQALSYISTNANQVVLCAGQPTNRTDATTDAPTGNALGESAITGTDFTGPADGDTNGRKLTFDGVTGVSVDVTDTCDHVALISGTELLLVTTVSSQAVSTGGTADISTFDYEISDPT